MGARVDMRMKALEIVDVKMSIIKCQILKIKYYKTLMQGWMDNIKKFFPNEAEIKKEIGEHKIKLDKACLDKK